MPKINKTKQRVRPMENSSYEDEIKKKKDKTVYARNQFID